VIDRVLIERHNFGPTDEYFTKIANNSFLRVYAPLGSKLISAVGFKGFPDSKFKQPDVNLQYKPELDNENSARVDENSGTKIYNENGKTVFANWSIAGPGETRRLLLVYKLPFKVAFKDQPKSLISMASDMLSPEVAAYSLKFQKQSGRSQDEFVSEVVYSNNLSLKLIYPDSAELLTGKAVFTSKTDSDKFFLVSFVKSK
jgi:hypothetical protein